VSFKDVGGIESYAVSTFCLEDGARRFVQNIGGVRIPNLME
jgi:hypothetical protein